MPALLMRFLRNDPPRSNPQLPPAPSPGDDTTHGFRLSLPAVDDGTLFGMFERGDLRLNVPFRLAELGDDHLAETICQRAAEHAVGETLPSWECLEFDDGTSLVDPREVELVVSRVYPQLGGLFGTNYDFDVIVTFTPESRDL